MTNKPLEALKRATAGKEPIAAITLEDLPSLKKAYEQAKKDNKEQFTYKGNEILVSYAKYLVEYMESLRRQP